MTPPHPRAHSKSRHPELVEGSPQYHMVMLRLAASAAAAQHDVILESLPTPYPLLGRGHALGAAPPPRGHVRGRVTLRTWYPDKSSAPPPKGGGAEGSERTCKPGSVERGHLSTPTVTDRLQRYSRTFSGGQPYVKKSQTCIGRGLHGTGRYRPVGELLPRLSILTSSKQISLPALRSRKERSSFDCFSSSQKSCFAIFFGSPAKSRKAKKSHEAVYFCCTFLGVTPT